MCIYAGVGSRETPPKVLEVMTQFAKFMARKSHVLRTGGAAGADSAFMLGAVDGPAEIYLPWALYTSPGLPNLIPMDWTTRCVISQAALDLAAKFHPAWNRCSPAAKKLHARNGFIVLGPNLNDPVKLVVAWTPGGLGGGGTGQALRIAQAYGIPVVDLGQYSDQEAMVKALNDTYLEYRP